MKKNLLLIFGIVLSIGLAQAQTDTMYFMKGNTVVLKQSVSPVDVDSIVLYNPLEIEGRSYAHLHWSEASLGTDVIGWDPAGKVPAVGDLPRFSRDYNWQVVGYYDDDEYQFELTDMSAALLDQQEVYVKVRAMSELWLWVGGKLIGPKPPTNAPYDPNEPWDVGNWMIENFGAVGMHLPPYIGGQRMTEIGKRAFYVLTWAAGEEDIARLGWPEEWGNSDYSPLGPRAVYHWFIPNTYVIIGDEAFMSSNWGIPTTFEFEQGPNMVTFSEDKNFHSLPNFTSWKEWNIGGANDPQWGRHWLGCEGAQFNVILPKHYNAISEECFRWANLDTIVVPASVYYIGIRAFLDDDAGNGPTRQGFFENASQRVKVIKFEGTTPPVLRRGRPPVPNPDAAGDDEGSAWHIRPIAKKIKRDGALTGETVKILVPTSAVDTYKGEASWADYADVIEGY